MLGGKLGGSSAPQSRFLIQTWKRIEGTAGKSSEREIETAAVVKHLLLCEREIGSDFDFS